jgi:hypothetical protein
MDEIRLPEGFRWTWAGDTVRIDLPPMMRTETHAYEPVLSAKDADRIADALERRERSRVKGGAAQKLKRILLAHDPRYGAERIAKFRARLSVSLVEFGHDATIDDMVTRSGMETDHGLGE